MSSSAEGSALGSLAEEALAVLRRELPSAFFEVGALLTGKSLRAIVDSEVIEIAFSGSSAVLGHPTRAVNLDLRAEARELLDLLEGRTSFQDALERGTVDVSGSVEDLLSFREALTTFVAGAARCPSFAALLDRFRQVVHGADRRRALARDAQSG